MSTLKSALETVDLFTYCTDSVLLSAKLPNKIVKRWYKADAAIQLILTSNMMEEVVAQLGHIDRASDMWSEAQRLFAGHTLTDWTLLVTTLVTTKYADSEDLTAHIAKMKSYRRDLILMKRDIADDLFACFLRISMPSTWNYVFAGLPSRYTPNKVERRIKDEYGIRTNQAGGASSYQPYPPSPYPPSTHYRNKCKTIGEPHPLQWLCERKTPPSTFSPLCDEPARKILDRLHMDLQGPFDRSITGYMYALVVVDDHSRRGWKEYLKTKDEAPVAIKDLITRLVTLHERQVKIVRSDRGGEFVQDHLAKWFKSKGITHELSAPYTPQQNGVVERFNRTTHEHALAMLEDAGMAKSFWPEAHEYASYTRNCSPTKALDKMTPYEAYHGQKPDLSTLRIFGSRCHVCIPPKQHKKLDAHSVDGIWCGFEQGTKAYKVWVPSKHQFVTSQDVLVYEKIFSHEASDDGILTTAPSEGVTIDNTTRTVCYSSVHLTVS